MTAPVQAMCADHDPIQEVACFSCVIPLPRPLAVGSATVTHRHYDVVRLRTKSGLEGAAYAFARGLPVARIVEQAIAPVIIGADARAPEAARRRIAGAHWPYAERGLFAVAASAVDLALWDLLGKRLGTPIADLLGRFRRQVPVCGVGGYTRPGDDSLATLQEDLAALVALGCASVKVTIGGADPMTDVRRLQAVREVAGEDRTLVVDAFRSFASIGEALHRLRLIDHFDIAYVEDPFPESLSWLAAELRRRSGMNVGLGETLNGHAAFRHLIEAEAVDVVRCDALVVGGVREFMASAALASARGLEVSTHVHPDVHVHFAAALTNLHPAGLEYMLPEAGLDALHELLETQLQVTDGHAEVPRRPGFGIDWNWDAVRRFANG